MGKRLEFDFDMNPADFLPPIFVTFFLWKCCRRKLDDRPVGRHWRHRDLKQQGVPLKAIAPARPQARHGVQKAGAIVA